MIKKLRMKLIIASMISLLAVLLIIEGIAGALNYNRIVAEADQTLDLSFHMNPDIFRYCLTVKGKCSQQIQERLPELILLMR